MAVGSDCRSGLWPRWSQWWVATRARHLYWQVSSRSLRRSRNRSKSAFALFDEIRAADEPIGEPADHARAAADWIARAQDNSGSGGIAKYYIPVPGRWTGPFPETSGYIVCSLLDYARIVQEEDVWADRARRIVDWLVDIQLPCGGIQSGTVDDRPIVPTIFNTGQVIHGWVDALCCWPEQQYERATERACRWLLDQQDPDGCWRRGGSPVVKAGPVNVYNTCTAWALIRAGLTLNENAFVAAGRRNLEWAATQEVTPGWCANNDFSDCDHPVMHTIAYAARGFFEGGLLLENEDFIALARRTCACVAGTQRPDDHLPGRLDRRFRPATPWACLTGDAQILALWRRFAAVRDDHAFDDSAARLSRALRTKQSLRHPIPGARGALPGSAPMNGGYCPNAYPNWATKFMLDAMIAEMPPTVGRSAGPTPDATHSLPAVTPDLRTHCRPASMPL